MEILIGYGGVAFVIAFLAGRVYGIREHEEFSKNLRRERSSERPRHRGVPIDVKDTN